MRGKSPLGRRQPSGDGEARRGRVDNAVVRTTIEVPEHNAERRKCGVGKGCRRARAGPNGGECRTGHPGGPQGDPDCRRARRICRGCCWPGSAPKSSRSNRPKGAVTHVPGVFCSTPAPCGARPICRRWDRARLSSGAGCRDGQGGRPRGGGTRLELSRSPPAVMTAARIPGRAGAG
jgi:hypothetical protein